MARLKIQLNLSQILVLTAAAAILAAILGYRRSGEVPLIVPAPRSISETKRVLDKESGELRISIGLKEVVRWRTVYEIGWPLPYNQSNFAHHQQSISQFSSETINWKNVFIDFTIPAAGAIFFLFLLRTRGAPDKKSKKNISGQNIAG